MRRHSGIVIALVTLFCLLVVADVTVGKKRGDDKYYDLVIFGIDRENSDEKGRSDVILIIHCESDRVTLFSVPRDTLTRVNGRADKLNHAFAYGGVKTAKAVLEDFLDFKIDNYIVVDFKTFLTTVDVIKKLTDDGRLIGAENFLASGENLLKWLRFRSLPRGDRRRCQRHQLFMKRVFAYTRDMFLRRPVLFSQCMKAGLKIVETDLTYDHAEKLYETYETLDFEKGLERFVLPGRSVGRYMANPFYGKRTFEEKNMPDFEKKVKKEDYNDPEKRKKRIAELEKEWKNSHTIVNYYIPKYKWSLSTYIRWYRKHGYSMNYKEVDTLRK